ncbi:MAG: nucleotidyltransferase [Bacteroides sp.]|nr:nucleotidyltransferase [Prevotella sp.]MCM1408315.1 hypothetical protein [Treponema brennaborense]MCM1470453.1 nucleotidyltransferase [Bacteroides sp.]
MKPTLLVLAAGMGSRYGGVKQIDAVGRHNECLLDYAAFDAKKSGFGKAVYVIRKDIEKDFRERFFDRVARNFDAEYVFQSRESLLTQEQCAASAKRTKPWGTIHAVLCAENVLKTPFAVINADDYYGCSAFKTLGNYLSSLSAAETQHAMVGYVLGNTMSKAGSVSRGICEVNGGYLSAVKEHTKIAYQNGNIISSLETGDVALRGDEWVSMNFFGFAPSVFSSFHEYWDDFLSKNVSSEKTEALLPEAVGGMIKSGSGTVKFFTSEEKWFGMTYPEDRESVKTEIAAKISSGYYPEILWEK